MTNTYFITIQNTSQKFNDRNKYTNIYSKLHLCRVKSTQQTKLDLFTKIFLNRIQIKTRLHTKYKLTSVFKYSQISINYYRHLSSQVSAKLFKKIWTFFWEGIDILFPMDNFSVYSIFIVHIKF